MQSDARNPPQTQQYVGLKDGGDPYCGGLETHQLLTEMDDQPDYF